MSITVAEGGGLFAGVGDVYFLQIVLCQHCPNHIDHKVLARLWGHADSLQLIWRDVCNSCLDYK